MFGALTQGQIVARAAFDLRLGLPVRVGDAYVMAVETLDAGALALMRGLGGDLCVTITDRRAQTLKTAAYDGDLARLAVEADMNLLRLRAIADPSLDLMSPLKGPFRAERGGDASAHRAAIQLCKIAHLLPAALVAVPDTQTDAPDLTRVTPQMVAAEAAAPVALTPVSSARVPLAVSQAGKVHVFRPEDGGEEHYAVEIGSPDRAAPVLSRLHSACFTGDILGSLKCDCGPQLNGALAQIAAEGAGVLLYLNQEGRGIGLANKMRAYSLQDQGFDTVEANHRLGFEDDERDFRIGAQILRRLGFSRVRLLTNNPAKVARMNECGLTVVERVPLKVGKNPLNADYLTTKATKSGHLL